MNEIKKILCKFVYGNEGKCSSHKIACAHKIDCNKTTEEIEKLIKKIIKKWLV